MTAAGRPMTAAGRPMTTLRHTPLLALLLASGCSAITHHDMQSPPCQVSCGVDPCREGYHCNAGFCAVCEETPEVCNGLDDNCNGLVDEGFDQDHDCATTCGAGNPEEVDCDDGDPSAYPAFGSTPAAAEICDGRDNDCNGLVDDGGAPILCPGGYSCVQGQGCVPSSCLVPNSHCSNGEICDFNLDPPACVTGTNCNDPGNSGICAAPEVCDPVSGQCVVPGPLSSDCLVDAQCASGQCTPLSALRLGGTGSICTLACCADADCGAGEICWASGSGTKVCIDEARLGRTRGAGGEGTSCTADTNCQSGICVDDAVDDLCLANCGSDADCSGVCTLDNYYRADVGDVFQMMCKPSTSKKAYRESCGSWDECESSYCIPLSDGWICSGACASSSDCAGVDADNVPLTYCGSRWIPEPFSQAVYRVQLCEANYHGGTLLNGAPCSFNGDCRDNLCFNGRCAGTCCTDAQCTGTQNCRPTKYGTHWEMRCN